MQNLAASFPQLPFLGPISSVANGNPTAPNPTTTNANSGSHPDQDAQENGGAGQEQQSQFGMDSANLQQLMLAAASAAANSNVEGNAFQKYYLSQMQSANSTPHIDPGTNPAMGNPAGDMDSGLGQQQSAINQSFFDTLFNTQQNQHQSLTPQVSAAEMLNGSKMQQMNQNMGNGFGEMTPELLAQIMDMVSGQQQNELKPSGQTRQMTHGPTHKMSAQSGCSSGDNSTPISPNGQQMNPASSQLFDQLQLLGILGGTSVSNGLNPADLFTSSNSYMNTTAANSALSQAFNANNNNSGSDFASLAASLNLNLNGGGASHASSMDTHNSQAATAAAVQAALLAATSGSFSQANFSGNSPNKSLDSYCEICDKQLCNRYFLKTHKQKKHGIYEDGSTAGSTGSPVKTSFGQSQGSFESDSYGHANNARSTAPTQSHSSVIVSSGQNAGSLDHDSDRHGSGDSSPLAKMPKLSSCSTSSSSSIQHNLMASLMNGTAGVSGNALHTLFGGGKSALDFLSSFPGIMGNGHTEQRTPTKSPAEEEQFNVTESGNTGLNACNYCDKEFDSRVNLLQHQILQHGGSSISTTFQRPACGSPLSSSTGATHGGSTSGCSEANPNGNLQSQLGNSFLNNLLPGGLPLPFLLPQQLAQFGGDMSGGGVQSPTAQGSQGTPKLVAKRQYSSTSKNYCDLCKKEVCNKYFLRTHMLKMHNIVIDENKSVIANIDTLEKERSGSISFRCDICQVNMQTRNDLRQHKREAHGLAPTPLLTPPLSGSLQTTPSRKSGIHTALGASGPSMVSQHSQKLMGQRFFGQPVPDNLSCDESEQNENDDETKPKLESDENAGTSAALAANVEMILNSIAGGKIGADKALSQVLAQGLGSNGQVKKEAADGSENDANSMDNNVPSSSASSTFEAANSATSSVSTSAQKCEICSQEFTDQIMLKFHHISQHGLGNANILSLLTQQQNQLPLNDGSDIITQIALEMAKANQAQNQGSITNSPALAAPVQHTCTHCNRQYKSKLALQNHTKLVHHNFVAKLSPTKKSKRPVISPKKVKKLRSSFTCMKCQRRFSTRAECSEHIIAHLKAEKEKENLQNHAFTAPNSQQSLSNTSPAVKPFRSNSFGNGHKEQDSNNNSASIHACRSLPMERAGEMGEREQIRRMSQPAGIELSRSKPSEFDDNLLCTFIREDLTDEEQDQVLSANHTQLTLSLEMPEAGPTPTSAAGAVGSGSAHPSSSSVGSSYDDGYLMIDANSEGNDAVDQVVSEIHEERCRRQSHHNIKEEKHSHTPEEQSSDHCEESDTERFNQSPFREFGTHNLSNGSLRGLCAPLSSGSSSGTSSTQTTQKPYAHQSFVLKTIHNNNSGLLFDELVAYLPVKAHIQEPVQLTIELHPSPHLDTHVKHLHIHTPIFCDIPEALPCSRFGPSLLVRPAAFARTQSILGVKLDYKAEQRQKQGVFSSVIKTHDRKIVVKNTKTDETVALTIYQQIQKSWDQKIKNMQRFYRISKTKLERDGFKYGRAGEMKKTKEHWYCEKKSCKGSVHTTSKVNNWLTDDTGRKYKNGVLKTEHTCEPQRGDGVTDAELDDSENEDLREGEETGPAEAEQFQPEAAIRVEGEVARAQRAAGEMGQLDMEFAANVTLRDANEDEALDALNNDPDMVAGAEVNVRKASEVSSSTHGEAEYSESEDDEENHDNEELNEGQLDMEFAANVTLGEEEDANEDEELDALNNGPDMVQGAEVNVRRASEVSLSSHTTEEADSTFFSVVSRKKDSPEKRHQRAAVVRKFGAAENILVESGIPIPTVGDKQILVQVHSADVNPVDTYIRSGSYAALPSLPYTPGREGAGIISKIGTNVKKLKVGDRVWFTQSITGSTAQFALTSTELTYPLSKELTFHQGATLGISYMTAYKALFDKAGAQAGQSVLIHGLLEGVGLAAAQLALAHGLQVAGTLSTEQQCYVQWAKKKKITPFNEKECAGFIKESYPDGFHIILQVLPNVNLAKDIDLVTNNGRIIVIGNQGSIKINEGVMDSNQLTEKAVELVIGVKLGLSTIEDYQRIAERINALTEAGHVSPYVGQHFPLDRIAEAHNAVVAQSNGPLGKIVIDIEHQRE